MPRPTPSESELTLDILRDNEAKRCQLVMLESELARLRAENATLREVNVLLKSNLEMLSGQVDWERLAKQ